MSESTRTLNEMSRPEVIAWAAAAIGKDFNTVAEKEAKRRAAKHLSIDLDTPVPDWSDEYAKGSPSPTPKASGEKERLPTHSVETVTMKSAATPGGTLLKPDERLAEVYVDKPATEQRSRINYCYFRPNGRTWQIKFNEKVIVPERVVNAIKGAVEEYNVIKIEGTETRVQHIRTRRYSVQITWLTAEERAAYLGIPLDLDSEAA